MSWTRRLSDKTPINEGPGYGTDLRVTEKERRGHFRGYYRREHDRPEPVVIINPADLSQPKETP